VGKDGQAGQQMDEDGHHVVRKPEHPTAPPHNDRSRHRALRHRPHERLDSRIVREEQKEGDDHGIYKVAVINQEELPVALEEVVCAARDSESVKKYIHHREILWSAPSHVASQHHPDDAKRMCQLLPQGGMDWLHGLLN